MKTRVITIEGVELIVREGYVPPYTKLQDFPDCCGAGEGFGEKVIPDKILGLNISAACDIHDDCFGCGEPTWADFHQSNSVFFRNIYKIIRTKSSNRFIGTLRVISASVYFGAVDTVGSIVYRSLREEEGHKMESIERINY